MRTPFLLCAVLVIAACSDNHQPTSPISRPTSRSGSELAPLDNGNGNGNPHGDLVGFTKVDMISGNWSTIDAGKNGGADVQCPAGSSATGGGFEFGVRWGTSPWVNLSMKQTQGPITGWVVTVVNDQPGAQPIEIKAFVLCVS